MLQEYNEEEEIAGFFTRLWRKAVNFIMWGISVAFLAVLGYALYTLLGNEIQGVSQVILIIYFFN